MSTYVPDYDQWNDWDSDEGPGVTAVVWRVPCVHGPTYHKPFVFPGHDVALTKEQLEHMREAADEEVRAQGFEPR